MRDNSVNSWAARPIKFQWQNLRAEHLCGPVSCTNNVRQLILVRNYIIDKLIRDVNLFDRLLERYKGNSFISFVYMVFKEPYSWNDCLIISKFLNQVSKIRSNEYIKILKRKKMCKNKIINK